MGLDVVNVAVTDCAWVMLTTHVVFVPVQAPLHPVKVAPDKGDAVRVTLIPAINEALQVLPQLMPAGLLVTRPLPLPLSETVNK